jgi:hypothetical protein
VTKLLRRLQGQAPPSLLAAQLSISDLATCALLEKLLSAASKLWLFLIMFSFEGAQKHTNKTLKRVFSSMDRVLKL